MAIADEPRQQESSGNGKHESAKSSKPEKGRIDPRMTPGPGNLWCGLPIEFIAVSGEFGVGKTLFALSIDPGPRTLVYDNEGSSTIYKSALGFKHFDMAAEVHAAMKRKNPALSRTPTPVERWLWWKEHSIKQAESKQFTVMVVDPFSELEAGLADYVKTHPEEFGATAKVYEKSSGIFWGHVKDALKAHLDNLRTLVETTVAIVHMRDEWKGNSPTGKREPKGKETLYELASLYLILEKNRKPNGELASPVPAARVEKSRLAHIRPNLETGEINHIAILPERLPIATPFKIREYIINPPDFGKLKAGERLQEEVMSEDEKLRLQLRIAEANAQAEEASKSKLGLMLQRAEQQAAFVAARPAFPDQSAAHAAKVEERTAARAEAANNQEQPPFDAGGVNQSTTPQDNNSPPPQPLAEWAAQAAAQRESDLAENNGFITAAQFERIKQSCQILNIPKETRDRLLANRGVNSFRNLTVDQANGLIEMFLKKELGFSQGAAPKN